MATNYKIYFCEDAIGVDIDKQKDILFWRPDDPKLKLIDASLDMELNKAGKLTFTMPYTHPYRSKVHKRKTRFFVERNGNVLWSGRVLDSNKVFNRNIKITVEGAMTYFMDTVVRPYSFDDVWHHAFVENYTGAGAAQIMPSTLSGPAFLATLIDWHNKYADDDKKFVFDYQKDVIGEDVEMNEFYITNKAVKDSSESYKTTKAELNDSIISKFGGFFDLEYNKITHKNRLKYYLDGTGIESNSAQTIEFGKNLLDFSETVSAENIFTHCIPLGATFGNIENLRKKAYDAEKKAVNRSIDKFNKEVSEACRNRKKADKARAEKLKKQEEDRIGYTRYKTQLAKYKKEKYQYDLDHNSEKEQLKNKKDPLRQQISSIQQEIKSIRENDSLSKSEKKAQIDPKKEQIKSLRERIKGIQNQEKALRDKAPTKLDVVLPPKNADGTTKTLKDYGYDSTSEEYKANKIPDEEKMPNWEDTDYPIREYVDKNEKVTINTVVRLWYEDAWRVTRYPQKKDYVTYSEKDVKRFGNITSYIDANVKLPKELPDNADECRAVYSTYISAIKRAGKDWLRKNRAMNTTLTVTAFDLAHVNSKIDHLDCGYSIPIKSDIHGISDEDEAGIGMLCSACTLDLLSPGNSQYTIGATFKALTDRAVHNKEQSGKAYGLAKSSYSMD